MRRNFALRPGFETLLRKLAVALPANLAIFWLLLHGNTKAVFLFGALGALLGALLLMLLEGHIVFSPAEAMPATGLRHRAAVREPDRYATDPRAVGPSAGWLRQR